LDRNRSKTKPKVARRPDGNQEPAPNWGWSREAGGLPIGTHPVSSRERLILALDEADRIEAEMAQKDREKDQQEIDRLTERLERVG
jgi:hypothetical protein